MDETTMRGEKLMAKAEIIKTRDQTVPQWLKEQFLGGGQSEMFGNNRFVAKSAPASMSSSYCDLLLKDKIVNIENK